jgi:hypothetical protein
MKSWKDSTPSESRRVGHRRGKIPATARIISQVKRQEEGDMNKIAFFFFGEENL